MGLDAAAMQFLCAAKSMGVDFTDMAMIGRQVLVLPDLAPLKRIFSVLGVTCNAEEFRRANYYGESFFSLLGAKQIASVDASSYEEATDLQDMNLPLDEALRERFTAVYDGGSLEHIFNIPQALKNCMEMVKVGGHFLQLTIANNFMGHGFWQFSPEVIYRVFTPENGYRVEAVLLHEVKPGGAWYLVQDPQQFGDRVELCNRDSTYIVSVARRLATADIFASPPQQADYTAAWNRRADAAPPPARRRDMPWPFIPRSLKCLIPWPVKGAVKGGLKRLRDLTKPPDFPPPGRNFQQACYRRITEAALLHGKLA